MKKVKVLDGVKGTSVDYEVGLLLKKFTVPQENVLITHEEIESLVGLDRKSDRYKVVIAKWKERLDDMHSVHIKNEPGRGYYAADTSGQVRTCVSFIKQIKVRAQKMKNRIIKIDRARLNDEEKRTIEHLSTNNGKLQLALRSIPKLPSPE